MSSLRLQTSLKQQMVLTPQLRQRIEMLQMTSIELSELIQEELLSNPILEEVQSGDEIREIGEKILDQNADGNEEAQINGNLKDEIDFASEVEKQSMEINTDIPSENGLNGDAERESESDSEDYADVEGDSFEEVDYGKEFQEYLDPGYRTQEIEYKEDAPSFDQFLSRTESLAEHLEWQLHLSQISEKQEDIAVTIIGNIDRDGRLNATIEEISEMCGCSVEEVEDARQIVMRLEPVGCGVNDVRECLLVQLEANGEADSLATELVANHLEDLQPHRLQHLSKEIGVELYDLNEEINKVRCLDPYPGRRYSTEEPIYVSPEVYIEKMDDDYSG
ncbi:hypothetical protein BH10ACI1_BH10ACI1_18780 [soil metagenome]